MLAMETRRMTVTEKGIMLVICWDKGNVCDRECGYDDTWHEMNYGDRDESESL